MSRLDNHVRMARSRGTELLPDDDAVQQQLSMLFWQGIREEGRQRKITAKHSQNLSRQLDMVKRKFPLPGPSNELRS